MSQEVGDNVLRRLTTFPASTPYVGLEYCSNTTTNEWACTHPPSNSDSIQANAPQLCVDDSVIAFAGPSSLQPVLSLPTNIGGSTVYFSQVNPTSYSLVPNYTPKTSVSVTASVPTTVEVVSATSTSSSGSSSSSSNSAPINGVSPSSQSSSFQPTNIPASATSSPTPTHSSSSLSSGAKIGIGVGVGIGGLGLVALAAAFFLWRRRRSGHHVVPQHDDYGAVAGRVSKDSKGRPYSDVPEMDSTGTPSELVGSPATRSKRQSYMTPPMGEEESTMASSNWSGQAQPSQTLDRFGRRPDDGAVHELG